MPDKNISPEIQAAYDEGRRDGIREAVRLITSVREQRRHEFFRGLWRATDADGWEYLDREQLKLLIGVATRVAEAIGDPPPNVDVEEHMKKFDQRERDKLAAQDRAMIESYSKRHGD